MESFPQAFKTPEWGREVKISFKMVGPIYGATTRKTCIRVSPFSEYWRESRRGFVILAARLETNKTSSRGRCQSLQMLNLWRYLPTLSRTHTRLVTWSAMCVRKVDAQCVPQFTSRLAAGCVLHRPASRVIHRPEWSIFVLFFCY